jgi:hypothetical protein
MVRLPALSPELLALLLVAGAGALWLLTRKGAAQAVGTAAGSAVVDAAAGSVIGVGDALGLPRTDANACAAALADGRWWEASYLCPAGDFIGGVFNPPARNTGGATGSW